MIKLKYLYFILLFFIFSSVKAETSNFEKGKNLFDEKKYDLAKFKFEQDIVFNPKNENSYLYLAKIYNFNKNNNKEEKNLNTVILLNPKNEDAIYSLAQLKLKKSDYKESKNLIDKLLIFCKDYCEKSQKLKIEIEKSLKK